jgi:hypothetical protein
VQTSAASGLYCIDIFKIIYSIICIVNRFAFTLDTVDNRYRFGALPGDAGVLSSLYGESVSRNQTLPPYKASPAELKKQKPIVAEMVDESVLFTHSVAATQALATLVEQTQVVNFGNIDIWILIIWLFISICI